jgi:hypothetical protein
LGNLFGKIGIPDYCILGLAIGKSGLCLHPSNLLLESVPVGTNGYATVELPIISCFVSLDANASKGMLMVVVSDIGRFDEIIAFEVVLIHWFSFFLFVVSFNYNT